jgi:hypothetical protein
MHAEYASGSALPEPVDELEPFVLVVVVPSCATPAPDEPPPHPAASNAEVAAAAASATTETLLPLHGLRRDTTVLLDFMSITP